jgi:hypothetical protein
MRMLADAAMLPDIVKNATVLGIRPMTVVVKDRQDAACGALQTITAEHRAQFEFAQLFATSGAQLCESQRRVTHAVHF